VVEALLVAVVVDQIEEATMAVVALAEVDIILDIQDDLRYKSVFKLRRCTKSRLISSPLVLPHTVLVEHRRLTSMMPDAA
jgi:hypothetical protein